MAKCLVSTAYTMKADLYQATITQDATGAVIKNWSLIDTIDCTVRGILRRGVGDNSVAVSLNDYINTFNATLKMRAQRSIPIDYRVVNVRNSEETIYIEDQDPASQGGLNNATIFEPRGSTPLTGLNGIIMEYETVLVRQEIQKLGI